MRRTITNDEISSQDLVVRTVRPRVRLWTYELEEIQTELSRHGFRLDDLIRRLLLSWLRKEANDE